MRYTNIGQDRASVIGLGAWQFGATEWGWQDSHRDEAIRIIHRALELGINVIDTAEAYAKGKSESIIGQALSGMREKAFLATKLLPLFPTPSRIRRAAKNSLMRLRTEQVDLYQIHWPNPVIPLSVQMRGIRAVQDAGWTTHVGVSNFSLAMWQKAEKCLGRPVMTNQVKYSLLRRKPDALLPWCAQMGRVVIAYSPLAQGLLTGKYGPDNPPRRDVRRMNTLYTRANLEAARPLLDALREIARKHGATCGQIALAWLIRRPNVIAIPGAKDVRQLEQNAAAADIELTEDDDARLTETSDRFHAAGLRGVPQFIGRLVRG